MCVRTIFENRDVDLFFLSNKIKHMFSYIPECKSSNETYLTSLRDCENYPDVSYNVRSAILESVIQNEPRLSDKTSADIIRKWFNLRMITKIEMKDCINIKGLTYVLPVEMNDIVNLFDATRGETSLFDTWLTYAEGFE